jgi:dTDP-4-dehydrorhamnose reductase
MEQVKKVFIIGSKGMAGHVIYYYLKEKTSYHIVDIARDNNFFIPSYNFDISNFSSLEDVLKKEQPDIIINCIGILNQDAEANPDNAILLNSYLPHFLARIGQSINCKVIHISTDCVFNGKRGNYAEDSFKDGIGIYAQTKALGELNYGNNLTIRTSIIGPELKQNGIGLFHWFMQQTGIIKGYSEAYWTGVTTIELAKAIVAAINQDLKGLHHLVNNERISKFELINLFKKIFKVSRLTIEKYDGYKVDKSLIRNYLGFDYQVPSYELMIEEMMIWISNHSAIYSYNF